MTRQEKIDLILDTIAQKRMNSFCSLYPELYKEINSLYTKLDGYPFIHKILWFINNQEDFSNCVMCDFYIPSTDTYIELNFSWMHGCEEYIGSENQRKKVEVWENRSKETNINGKIKTQYKQAIKVWTIRDPIKKQHSIDNKLNWLCFYDKKQFLSWFDSKKIIVNT